MSLAEKRRRRKAAKAAEEGKAKPAPAMAPKSEPPMGASKDDDKTVQGKVPEHILAKAKKPDKKEQETETVQKSVPEKLLEESRSDATSKTVAEKDTDGKKESDADAEVDAATETDEDDALTRKMEKKDIKVPKPAPKAAADEAEASAAEDDGETQELKTRKLEKVSLFGDKTVEKAVEKLGKQEVPEEDDIEQIVSPDDVEEDPGSISSILKKEDESAAGKTMEISDDEVQILGSTKSPRESSVGRLLTKVTGPQQVAVKAVEKKAKPPPYPGSAAAKEEDGTTTKIRAVRTDMENASTKITPYCKLVYKEEDAAGNKSLELVATDKETGKESRTAFVMSKRKSKRFENVPTKDGETEIEVQYTDEGLKVVLEGVKSTKETAKEAAEKSKGFLASLVPYLPEAAVALSTDIVGAMSIAGKWFEQDLGNWHTMAVGAVMAVVTGLSVLSGFRTRKIMKDSDN